MKVLCFGSLNIDYTYRVDHFVKKGETLSSDNLRVFCGGKGLNQSVALARAGAETFHAGAIGEDGLFLLQQMEEAGVNTDCVAVLPNIRSGHAIIQNDREGDNCILLYGGANQAITREQADRVLERFGNGDFLVLQNEISELGYIMERAAAKGMKIVLNPSPMNEKITRLPLECVAYFLLNEIEALQILGDTMPEDKIPGAENGQRLAQALRERFKEAAVVLTMGAEGSVFMDKNETVFQKAYRVQAVDTTAAGDTFTGYFIAGLIRGLGYKEAMDQAAKAAAIAVTRPGASSSIPELREVEESYES